MILTDGTHLVSTESLDELHRFAKGIGLKRIWFQGGPKRRYPHYDIFSQVIQRAALRAGAKMVSAREVVEGAIKEGVKE
jgi:hypothetical protein